MSTTETTTTGLRELAHRALTRARADQDERRAQLERDRQAAYDRRVAELQEAAAGQARDWGIGDLGDPVAWRPVYVGDGEGADEFGSSKQPALDYVTATSDGVTLRVDGIYKPNYQRFVVERPCPVDGHQQRGGTRTTQVASLAALGARLAEALDPDTPSEWSACTACRADRAAEERARWGAGSRRRRHPAARP